MALTKRVELLLDPRQYAQLEEIARARKESVGALVRRALEREYLRPAREERRAAAEWLLSQETDFGDWEEVKQTIIDEKTKEIIKNIEAS
ncbi:MAG: ribbon-helix-helix protein, CopG family [Chloroflexota bacterium]|nr:MAG: ribbon-helix-helix protein, CopG family [Chloroflexota bacterium]